MYLDICIRVQLIVFFEFLRSRTGYYQTGATSAVACDVLVVEEVSACGGGEACAAERIGLPVAETCYGAAGTFDASGSTSHSSRIWSIRTKLVSCRLIAHALVCFLRSVLLGLAGLAQLLLYGVRPRIVSQA